MKPVSLVGYGGAGKAALILRAARERFERGQRTLILTYHTALTSDLYRQLMLLGIRQSTIGRSVNVETLDRFFREWVRALDSAADCSIDDDWFERRYRIAITSIVRKIEGTEFMRSEMERTRAREWALIPLTRSIDSLVSGLLNDASELGAALLSTAEQYSDFVCLH